MTNSTPTKNATGQLVNVVLQKNHTHAGAKYGAGSLLTVDQTNADWLIQQGIAKQEEVVVADKKRPA